MAAVNGYVAGVTEKQFWARVGRELGEIRRRAGYDKTYSAYRAGAPATATLNDIEEGRIGNIDSLSAYCEALKVSLLDVLRVALDEAEEGPPLSADSLWVARMYQEGPDADLRAGMLGAAKAQSRLLSAAPAASTEERPETRASGGGSRGRGRTVRHHR